MKNSIILFLITSIIILFIQCNGSGGIELKNEDFSLVLGINDHGIPYIKKGYWTRNGETAFINTNIDFGPENWLPQDLVISDSFETDQKTIIWRIWHDDGLLKAKAQKVFDHILVQWTVELTDRGSLFNMYIQLSNIGQKDIPVQWFPIWTSTWNLPPAENKTITYWQALSYEPERINLKVDSFITLQSKVYSSDNLLPEGQVPFWKIKNAQHSLFFSISWCGGWLSELSESKNGTNYNIVLPPDETQLILKPGETIKGPTLNIFASKGPDPVTSRSEWLFQRALLAEKIFNKPDNWFPLIYNHWYSVRFNLSSEFMHNQVQAILPYHFDVFVVDAGWYNTVGDWTPNVQKFRKGDFEKILKNVKGKGIKVGLWSCPWLVEVDHNNFPPEVDEPRYYRQFMNAYALDLAGFNFEKILTDHISELKVQFDLDWWKYDQEFFGEKSRKGKIRNVIALENSLKKVRQMFPDLIIENCMSGGRMINEFTDQISQAHWIRDGGSTGLKHARSNIRESLGAIQFLSPAKVQRWTNRLNEIDENDGELLKMYCRSAMVGIWGISAEMNKISNIQREVILDEIQNYRKINILKPFLKYDIIYPYEGSDIAGIIYYDADGLNAMVLLFRWDKKGHISKKIKLNVLDHNDYQVINIDTEEKKNYKGKNLKEDGYTFTLNEEQLSTFYSIKKVAIK